MTDKREQVDALFTQWDRTTSPGCALAVIHNGEIVYKRGYGMANLELGVPITPQTVFYIASTSKQFAAMAIALLIEDGRITANDDIRRHIPEMPDYGTPITVSHIVHHTSGIRDYLELGALAGKKLEDVWTENEALGMIARQKELNFRPGDRFLYSNSGYVLMSIIVHRVSGMGLAQFAHERMFKPLGMMHSFFKDNYKMLIPNRATGYAPGPDGGFENAYSNLETVGDGGLFTSVEDLYLWDQNYYHNRLGKGAQSLIERMLSTEPFNDGKPSDYAFGLMHGSYRGQKTIAHGGGLNGARTQMTRFPDQKFTVICLSNLGSFNPDKIVQQVADIYLADVLGPVEEAAAGMELSQDVLESRTGLYRCAESGVTRRLDIHDGKLRLKSGTLDLHFSPQAENRFLAEEYPVVLTFENDCFQEQIGSGSVEAYERVEEAHPTPEELQALTGRYYSDELQSARDIALEDSHLVARHPRLGAATLQPTIPDGFSINGLDVLFSRDSQGEPTGFTLESGRVRHLRFERQ